MAAPQSFRTAFNGFHKEDVVRYLEFMNNRHQAQLGQMASEMEQLRAQLAKADKNEALTFLEARCVELEEKLAAAESERDAFAEKCLELEGQLAAKTETAVEPAAPIAPVLAPGAAEELETYRRAERIEREARERAELVYFQANGVLTEATAKVDGIAADITDMADQVMAQLTQLQMAVSGSKQALQDASAIMNTIRPNK